MGGGVGCGALELKPWQPRHIAFVRRAWLGGMPKEALVLWQYKQSSLPARSCGIPGAGGGGVGGNGVAHGAGVEVGPPGVGVARLPLGVENSAS